MKAITSNENNLDTLARRMVRDMHHRGLLPGDRYMIAKEAGQFLDVSSATAHRAMQILANRKILVRQKKAGTFVGPAFHNVTGPDGKIMRVVHVMMATDYWRSNSFPGNIFVEIISKTLPKTAVQIHYVPEHQPLEYTRQVLNHIEAGDSVEGVILIRSTKQVQHFISTSKAKTVVFGSVYPGIKNLSWLDVDQAQTGRLMAEYAVSRGHKRFVLITYNEWRRGDNIMLNAITGFLGDAGFGMDTLTLCSLPPDRDAVLEEIHALFSMTEAPTVFMCRGDFYADMVLDVASMNKLEVQKDFDVISGGHLRLEKPTKYPCIVSSVSIEEQVNRVVQMLRLKAEGKEPSQAHVVIPVEILSPNGNGHIV